MVEMAVILPLLLIVLLGAVDFARIGYLSVVVSGAANAGARFGAQSVDNASNTSGIRKAAVDDLGTVRAGTPPDVTVERYCACAPGNSRWPCDDAPCPPAIDSSPQPRMFVRVRVESTFSMLFPYPGLPESTLIAREAEMRVQ